MLAVIVLSLIGQVLVRPYRQQKDNMMEFFGLFQVTNTDTSPPSGALDLTRCLLVLLVSLDGCHLQAEHGECSDPRAQALKYTRADIFSLAADPQERPLVA